MHPHRLLLPLLPLATASLTANQAYLSPSLHHPSLGISLHRVAKRTHALPPLAPDTLNFTHGVASGDPHADSVILWTRLAPAGVDNGRSNVTVAAGLYDHRMGAFVDMGGKRACVRWVIGEERDGLKGRRVVDGGTVYTSSDVDWVVKVEARRLRAWSTYYYQFFICDSNKTSPIGRTKTLPESDQQVPRPVRLAVYSCSNYPFGFFNAYGNTARKDSVDYVVHLGDYIYEYENGQNGGWGNSMGRVPLPDKEIVSLYDYRKRLATYRTDLDLLASHQMFPWIAVWDDHEVADNTWRDGSSHMNNTEQSFVQDGGVSFDQRKMNAVRAYFEWMPIRQVDMDDNLRIWRRFRLGTLLDLIMLDTRQYDRSVTDVYWNRAYVNAIAADAGRSIMGPRQEAWLRNTLRDSAHGPERAAVWRIVGSQVLVSRMNESVQFGEDTPFNADSWDGYQMSRARMLRGLQEDRIGNTVFLAGDSHASWVADIPASLANVSSFSPSSPDGQGDRYDPSTGRGSIAVEFAGSAVSSPCPWGPNITAEAAQRGSEWLTRANPALQWQDLFYRGYYELSVGYEEVRAEYFGIPTTKVRRGLEVALASFVVKAGENRLWREGGYGGDGTVVVVGGKVASGSLKGGVTDRGRRAVDTKTGGMR